MTETQAIGEVPYGVEPDVVGDLDPARFHGDDAVAVSVHLAHAPLLYCLVNVATPRIAGERHTCAHTCCSGHTVS